MSPVADIATARSAGCRSIDLDLHGVGVRVISDEPELIERVIDTWGRLAVGETASRRLEPGAGPASISLVHEDGRRILRDEVGRYEIASDASALVALFDRIVVALTRGLDQTGILAIHAGAVEIDGRAVILAGPSGRGKSTLVVELVRRGAGFLSDECALVARDDQTVLAYPRAVHLRPATLELIPDLVVAPERPRHELGGGSDLALGPDDFDGVFGGRVADRAELGGVLLLGDRLAPDAMPRVEPIPAAIAVMELLRGTTAASWAIDRTRNRLIDVVGSVRCGRLFAGDLGATAALVSAWARGEP